MHNIFLIYKIMFSLLLGRGFITLNYSSDKKIILFGMQHLQQTMFKMAKGHFLSRVDNNAPS